MSESDPKKRKSIWHLSDEEIKSGEWRKDPELVREAAKIFSALSRGLQQAFADMPEEEREEVERLLEDAPLDPSAIHAKGDM